jgi:hypothetical protein
MLRDRSQSIEYAYCDTELTESVEEGCGFNVAFGGINDGWKGNLAII